MIRSLSAAALLVLLSAPALAGDPRLTSRPYNPNEVVRIDGRAGVQATIAFDPDEHIENVAIGDSAGWQVTPNKRANLLFVKPLSANARTNMTVVTDRHSYFFDLIAAPASGNKPIYVLRFTYPDTPKKSPAAAPANGLTAEEAQMVNEKPVDPASLNFAWRARGSSKLYPTRIYDDGNATYLSWKMGAPVPAILVRDEKKVEGPVNFAVRGDVIVIDGVFDALVLRSGQDSATLENQGPPRPLADAPEPAPAVPAPAVTESAALSAGKES